MRNVTAIKIDCLTWGRDTEVRDEMRGEVGCYIFMLMTKEGGKRDCRLACFFCVCGT